MMRLISEKSNNSKVPICHFEIAKLALEKEYDRAPYH